MIDGVDDGVLLYGSNTDNNENVINGSDGRVFDVNDSVRKWEYALKVVDGLGQGWQRMGLDDS